MKRQTSFVVGLLLVAAMSLPMTGVASAKTGPRFANQITIKAQDANRGQINIDSVTAAQEGWLVIYTDPCIRRCAMIGYTPVHRGLNTNFTADINSDQAQLFSTLWAVLYVDKGLLGLLELPGPDEPVVQDGKPVMVAFGTHPAPPPGPPPAKKTASKPYAKLQADYRILNWCKSDTPGELIGALQVDATGGDGHYTYSFIGARSTDTFNFQWRACSALVESLHVSSGDGQKIVVPVWRTDLPCPKDWDDPICDCACNCGCGCKCDCDCGCTNCNCDCGCNKSCDCSCSCQ